MLSHCYFNPYESHKFLQKIMKRELFSMKIKIASFVLFFAGTLFVVLLYAKDGYSYPNYCPGGTANCTTCHGVGYCTQCPSDPACSTPPPSCTDNDGDNFAVGGGNCGLSDCNDNDATINPAADEVCDDGIDNNCNGSIDEGCNVQVTCADGTVLIIKKIKYRKGRLLVKGRAAEGATITVTDAGTVTILADGIGTKGTQGAWNTVISNLQDAPEMITVSSSSGCDVTFNKVLLEKFNYNESTASCAGDELSLEKMKYTQGKLLVKGRATQGNTVTVTDDNSSEIIAEGLETRGKRGNWKTVIKKLIPGPSALMVESSDGCSALLEKGDTFGQQKVIYKEAVQP